MPITDEVLEDHACILTKQTEVCDTGGMCFSGWCSHGSRFIIM